MSLFQNSVVSKYLNTLNKDLVTEKWAVYKNHFLNPTIQDNIRNSKEEQYQGEFLIDLFVNVLGYTKNPTPNFNLTTELKNEKDSKKADGGIIINDKVVGVIELKGTNTTDLNKIEIQAFGYKNNQKDCVYVITSNFEKLRFYVDNAIEHIDFNLFHLTEKEFKLLYLYLAFDTISKNIPKKIKDESVSEEDRITKDLYKDYSVFKRALFNDLVEKNPQFEPLELFKKSQKLLDRFLFLFFAEDRQLLPPNSVRSILDDWKDLQEKDVYIPLYDRYRKYFEYLNTGYKGKRYDVFAYNGGLFKPDTILDTIKIDDNLIYNHTLKLATYDFVSEVDVNILGHIFENSLNELDEMKVALSSMEHAPSSTMEHAPSSTMEHAPLPISKRKKDGVFYTPKYITKYIVENTVGKLCNEKRPLTPEGGISPKLPKKQKEAFLKEIQEYRNWLLKITIIDPACGSGAFLNEALNFLIAEHNYIDELQAKLFGDALVLSDVEKSILENNLFGVDLNEESVEIAKLSLWLRTAQPNRKLNDLNNNIKCGNSLIDDPEIAGDKAFNWQKEFPSIFKEKDKKPWHVTTALYDSRTSQRMIDYKVREKRDMGTNPFPNVQYLTPDEESIIAKMVYEIATEDNLNILAFNVCKDHMHIVLVCDEESLPKITQKIKAKTARSVNICRGVTTEHAPLAMDTVATTEHAPLSVATIETTEHAPLSKENEKTRGAKQNSLWTQKYGCNEITTTEQLHNAINYVKNNRSKHQLPPHNKQTQLYIDNMLCTEEKAFAPEYNGGFDVVVGNPPYVQIQSMGTISNDLENRNFQTFEKTGDLYCLFYELGNIILKDKGSLGYITSNKWLRANYGKSLRNYLLKNTQPIELLDLGSGIFESATVDSNILIFEKTKTNKKPFIGLDISKEKVFVDFSIFESKKIAINPNVDDIWTISNPLETQIKQKIEKAGIALKNWDVKINRGLTTGFNDAFIINEETKNQLIKEDSKSTEIIKPVLRGREIYRYNIEFSKLFIINSHNGYDNFPEISINDFPFIKKHLNQFYKQLENRGDKGKTPYNLRNCAYVGDFYKRKIVFSKASKEQAFSIDEQSLINLNTSYFLIGDYLELILCVLNSNLAKYVFLKFYQSRGIQGEITIQAIEQIPIPKIPNSAQQPFIEKAEKMLTLNKELQKQSQQFQRTIQRKFMTREHAPLPSAPLPLPREHAPLPSAPLPRKLQEWYLLSYTEFIKELAKQKIKLTLQQEAEWEEYFTSETKKVLEIKNDIETTDKEIDTMVYELYGLTEEEIAIVENSK